MKLCDTSILAALNYLHLPPYTHMFIKNRQIIYAKAKIILELA